MTISREKCLEMVKEAGGERRVYRKSPGQDHVLMLDTALEALINRAYAEGQRDMRERAGRLCEYEILHGETDEPEDIAYNNGVSDCIYAIKTSELCDD